MQTKFIELTSTKCRQTHYINPIMICNITEYCDSSNVCTIGGQVIEVKENFQEIKK